MYTLEEIYDNPIAVFVGSDYQIYALLNAIRANPPEQFTDHWIDDDFYPQPGSCICIDPDEEYDGKPCWTLGYCDEIWFKDMGYEIVDFQEVNLDGTAQPRELVSEGLESLFNLEVL